MKYTIHNLEVMGSSPGPWLNLDSTFVSGSVYICCRIQCVMSKPNGSYFNHNHFFTDFPDCFSCIAYLNSIESQSLNKEL